MADKKISTLTGVTTPLINTIVFDITLSKLRVYSGAAWQTITSAQRF